MDDLRNIIAQMTLREKCEFLSGSDLWHTTALERLGVPRIMLCDGPHGLRKQDEYNIGSGGGIPATCFPSAACTASSWNTELLTEIGKAVGEEAQAENVAVVLGPGCNIKRSPLCGRNFEYFSEDPELAGEMAAAFINGVQSEGVGTSLKHFCCNNKEELRMRSDSVVDERTLREIYLTGFEKAVKMSKPQTVMCAYNKVNGTYLAENRYLLTDVLRGEWGFDGLVMTDWGAIKNRAECVRAGIDLEMPGCEGLFGDEAEKAVLNGELDESLIDGAVYNILKMVKSGIENQRENASFSVETHNELAARAAAEGAVLLKNDDALLPLSSEESIAVIGEFAENPRFQGGGSSYITPFMITSLLDSLGGFTENYSYARGFEIDSDETNEALADEAVRLAKKCDKVIIMAGLPISYEFEGSDRRHMRLPANQNELIKRICAVSKKVAVVLSNGSAVEMPWLDDTAAVLETYLAGQASGEATARLLFGAANPSGKISETFPLRLEDTPSYLNFAGARSEIVYAEGVFVGYRYYEKKQIKPLFPFGFGLSYTSFEYSALTLDRKTLSDSDKLCVSVRVRNTGGYDGAEVVQLYVSHESRAIPMPVKQLRAFKKVFLKSGEEKEIFFELSPRAFAYYNAEAKDWYTERGEYGIHACSSSDCVRLSDSVKIDRAKLPPIKITKYHTLSELDGYSQAEELILRSIERYNSGRGTSVGRDDFIYASELSESPFEATAMMMPYVMSYEELYALDGMTFTE